MPTTKTPTLGQTVMFVKSKKLSYTGIVVSNPEPISGRIDIYTYPSIKSPVWKNKVAYSEENKPGTWHWVNN